MADGESPVDIWIDNELDALLPSARAIAEDLIEFGIKRWFSGGAPVIAQGNPVSEIYFIAYGRAVSQSIASDGSEVWGNDFLPGDFVGHSILLSDIPYPFEVICETDICVLAIPAHRFTSILQEKAAIGQVVATDLAVRLNAMTERLIELSTMSAPSRICAELMRQAKPIGIEAGKMVVRPSPVFSRLAKRVNSTRETVSRTIGDLQKNGLISREPGALRIENPEEISQRIHA